MTIVDHLRLFCYTCCGSSVWVVLTTALKATAFFICLLPFVAYLTYGERKVIGYMQGRLGPNRVGLWGLLQPIADVLKLLSKEIVIPTHANRFLFILAPVVVLVPSLAAWAVFPFQFERAVANIDAGLLYLLAITSLGVYGIIIAGWASNSRYAFLGAMRSGAQIISYEVAMGFALIGVLLVSGTLNLSHIVLQQQQGLFHRLGLNLLSWNWLPLFPMFLIYLISGIAETNRHPFDVIEGESEIVAGFHVEYSGMAFALFFLAEYANMVLISGMTAVMFLGGWDAPLGWGRFLPGVFWLFVKVCLVLLIFIWARATFPRYRYDQIMRLGWTVFLPVALVWVLVVAVWMKTPLNIFG